LCSHSKRTKQTAELIKKIFKLDVEIIETELLNEVHFDPKKQMSFEEYQKKGLQLIRQRLFEGMQTGKGAENMVSILDRISSLEEYLNELPFASILCDVTRSDLCTEDLRKETGWMGGGKYSYLTKIEVFQVTIY
jgi:broad specificity phosphatase PhoE